MGWITAVFVYFVTWFLMLFVVLPWGARRPDNPEPGHADSAPDQPRLALKFTITSLLAAVVWLVIFLIAESNLISFRDMAREM